MPRHVRVPVVGYVLSPVGSEFVSVEALGGTVLLAATLAGFVWANVSGASYDDVWVRHLTIGGLSLDLRHWVNDGLMAVFFFVVGLEIKRELVLGELRNRKNAALPVIAAIGGMIVPALLYLAVNASGPGRRGWAIPMATDIAFALVLLISLGSRVPQRLRLFLLTLAIVDDIGAIVVIALFYSEHLAIGWLVGALAIVAFMLLMSRLGLSHPVVFVVPAIALWVCTYESGVHATIAGVTLGLLIPARQGGGREVIDRLLHRLHPVSSLLVIPIFAVANAGVRLDATALHDAATSRIAWGVILGLVVGKPLGIMIAAGVSRRLGLASLPEGLDLRDLFGVACVAGIGFTVSLFVADLSFHGANLSDAKIGILAASILSAVVGGSWLYKAHSPRRGQSAESRTGDTHNPR